MTSAPPFAATPFVASPRQPQILWIAAVVSVLLHAAVPGAMLLDLAELMERWRAPPETVIEVVFLPPKPEPEPEPPPPPAPAAVPTPPPVPMTLSPPAPQLEQAEIAERSKHADPEPRRTETPSPPPAPQIERPRQRQRQPTGENRHGGPPLPPVEMPRRADAPNLIDRDQPTISRGARSGGSTAEKRQQSEGDFVLAQIMPHWLIDVRSPRFRGVVLGGTFHLQADGTLASPYGKNDPWTPDVMIQNYRQMNSAQSEPVRIALESFLRAARTAQPFRLPPGVTGGYPRPIRIVFNMGDLQ